MKRGFLLLCLILLGKAFIAMWTIQVSPIGLAPDEAQYWTWSRELDWGYYSKPPGIAWQIWLGTQIFGHTELGIRFMAIVISLCLALAVYGLARACRLKQETAFFAGLIMAFSPLGIFSTYLATTDGGMVLFWTLACAVIARALSSGTKANWPLFGLMIFCGALFKWTIFILWIPVIGSLFLFRHLVSKQILFALIISLLGLLPSVIWNAQHDWPTFQHVFTQVSEVSKKGNFFDFLGAQAMLLSPILFALLLIAFTTLIRAPAQLWPQLLFCGGLSFSLLFIYLTLSIFKKMQGNWCVFAYPTAIVFLSWYCLERVRWGRFWLYVGLFVSVTLSVFAFTIPLLENYPYKLNPFRHNLGWRKLDQELANIGYDPEHAFLFGDKYQMTSILSFYSPQKKRAYFLNLHGARKNQFSYWPGIPKGESGYFVLAENMEDLEGTIPFYEKELRKYFLDVEFLGIKPLYSTFKGAIIFKCNVYNGLKPKESQLF